MRKAAIVMGITQPPVSYAIKQLEESLAVKLFDRFKHGVEPTPAADKLYTFAKRYFLEMENVEYQMRAPTDIMAGSLSVGTYDSIARYFWPQIFFSSSKEFPNLSLRMSSNRTTENINLLRSKEIDYSILVEPSLVSTKQSEIEFNILYTDTYSIFQNKDANENHSNFIYVKDAFSSQSESLGDYLKTTLKGYQEFSLDSFEICREFIKKGLGIGVLPNRVAEEDVKLDKIKRIKLNDIPLKFSKHRIFECSLKNNTQRKRIDKFSQLVRKIVKH